MPWPSIGATFVTLMRIGDAGRVGSAGLAQGRPVPPRNQPQDRSDTGQYCRHAPARTPIERGSYPGLNSNPEYDEKI